MATIESCSYEIQQKNEASDASGNDKRVRWDESGMHSVTPDVLHLEFVRNEINLLLGAEQIHSTEQELAVKALSRLVMNPFTAKQLAIALDKVIRECELRYGERDLYQKQSHSMPAGSAGKADKLFQLVRSLNVEIGFEKSFKISERSLLGNRFLLGMGNGLISGNPHERILSICEGIGMPENLMGDFEKNLPNANYVHFGFEENEQTCVYKIYLEFFKKIVQEIGNKPHGQSPFLLHLGYKWDVSDPARQSLTHYTWYPWLSSDEILNRVLDITEPDRGAAARQAAEQLILLALARIPARDILYLEVTEAENPRRSYDINIYNANLQIAEVYPLLSTICRRQSIPFGTFHSLYDGIKTKRFGHLAAGVDRKGMSFFTVYYGVEPMFGEIPKKSICGDESVLRPTKYNPPLRRRSITWVEETDDKAGNLLNLVKGIGLRSGFERSFKLLDRMLLTDRFLIGVKRETTDIKQKDDAIRDVCRRINMPDDFQEMFQSELNEADYALFGIERNEKKSVYKAYLEFNTRLKEGYRQDPRPESIVMYYGFKWDASDNSKKIVTLYRAYYILQARDIAARVSKEFYRSAGKSTHRIVDDILDLAGSRTQAGEIIYFEVREEGNPRSSFDINVYKANLQMAEIYPLLVEMARHYSIEPGHFEDLYDSVKNQKFGHLSGGADREGRDFLTVYFSEKGSRH